MRMGVELKQQYTGSTERVGMVDIGELESCTEYVIMIRWGKPDSAVFDSY